MAKENEIVLFETEDKEITLNVKVDQDTVWLNRNQMADLFGRDVKTIGKHINNALKEELDTSTVANFATVQNEGGRDVERNIEYYNLDMIISVGYRVKSQRGIEFRRWANKVLKDYIIKGYAINDKRLKAFEELADEIDALREEKQDLLVEDANRAAMKQRLDELEEFLDEHQEPVTDYDEGMVRRLIERITVYEDHLDFEFKSGLETEVQM